MPSFSTSFPRKDFGASDLGLVVPTGEEWNRWQRLRLGGSLALPGVCNREMEFVLDAIRGLTLPARRLSCCGE